MKIRCISCTKKELNEEFEELDDMDRTHDNLTWAGNKALELGWKVYWMDNGSIFFFCDDKKCQKKIEEKVESFEYTHILKRDGLNYYISDLQFNHASVGGYDMYSLMYYTLKSIVFRERYKPVWVKRKVITDLSGELVEEDGTLYIEKNRVEKQ